MNLLLLAIFAMLVQQTVATTAKVGLPALFPAVAADLSFNVELVLAYTWFFALVSLVFMAGCGGIIRRYGALRTSQFGCISMALGLLIAALTNQTLFIIPSFALIILLISAGTTVATPASSQILAEYAPRKWAPLVFSIKQTGVPAGVAISGLVLVPLAVGYGWRMTLTYTALICVIIAIVLQPLREEFDKKRDPTEIPRWSDFISNIKDVLSQGQRREMAIAAFSFVGMQSVYTNFTITYLYEDLGFSLEEAGEILGFATLLAIPARILWGWVGSTIFQPRVLLAFLALVMAVSTALMGAFDDQWGHVAVLIVNCAISLSVLSWHGVLLSEAARLAPAGEAGRLTGGVLAFGALGQIIFPMIFAAGYWLSGYGLAFTVISLPAAMVGVIFLLWRR
jgi:MFS family permease